MIGQYTKGNAGFIVASGIFFSGYFFCFTYGATEYIRIIIALFLLEHPYKPFESHTGIYVLCRKLFEGTVFFTVVLYEYIVPYFYYLRMIFIHQISSGNFGSFFIGTAVDMDLSTWTARTGITHFPEIIFLISENDAVFSHNFFPFLQSDAGRRKVFFSISFKNGYV